MTKTLSIVLLGLLIVLPAAVAEEEEPRRPPPGAASGMWERLRRFDADGDGKVSRDEFQGPDRFFDRLDRDGDGAVTKEEVEALEGQMRQGGGRRPGAGRQQGGQRGGLSFQRLDTDRDGHVSHDEWAAFYRRADGNGDGRLSSEEWAAALHDRPSRGRAPAVGSAAPKVKAKYLDKDEVVDLSQPRRATVLVFGSWT